MVEIFLFLLFLVALAIAAYFLVQKEKRRRTLAQQREAEFVASVRDRADLSAATTQPGAFQLASASKTESEGYTVRAKPGDTAGLLPSTPRPVSPSRDVLGSGKTTCALCGGTVEVTSNDSLQWGVKIPDQVHDRVLWYHFLCINRALERKAELEIALAQLLEDKVAQANDSTPPPGPP